MGRVQCIIGVTDIMLPDAVNVQYHYIYLPKFLDSSTLNEPYCKMWTDARILNGTHVPI